MNLRNPSTLRERGSRTREAEMEWWFVVITLTWNTQTVELTPYGPYKTPTLCERKQGHVEIPTRSELITISPCFKKYIREKS